MTDLPRLRPEPIPAIHPLPEYLAEGPRKVWYEDMKQVFQVPWMGVVTMAYAHYPTFYETLWQGVRDLDIAHRKRNMAKYLDVRDACVLARPAFARWEDCRHYCVWRDEQHDLT